MSADDRSKVGTVGWTDLTVDDAGVLRDFYGAVVGWLHEPVDMGGYADFNMLAPGTGEPAVGICHRRGSNADLPAQWMIYINVGDLDASLRACRARGGELVVDAKSMGSHGRYAVIRDPAGAVCALFEPAG